MRLLSRTCAAAVAATVLLTGCGQNGQPSSAGAVAAKSYRIGWSLYAGFMPWGYAERSGILKKWADRYGIKIDLVEVNDYVESINQFTAGTLDGVASTNMDAMTLPAASGKDTTVVLIGDYSFGNDGVVLKGPGKLGDIKGRPVNLVAGSVSQYLLLRALQSVDLHLTDVKMVNTADADIAAAFGSPATVATVTWNPQLHYILRGSQANEVFSSRQIPGEIQDSMVVSTAALKANPNLGKALAGAWYETLALMRQPTPEGVNALTTMAGMAGTDLPGYRAQLADTHLFYTPKDELDFLQGKDFVQATDRVRRTSFEAGLFGGALSSIDKLGVALPNGQVAGDPNAVRLRYPADYVAGVGGK